MSRYTCYACAKDDGRWAAEFESVRASCAATFAVLGNDVTIEASPHIPLFYFMAGSDAYAEAVSRRVSQVVGDRRRKTAFMPQDISRANDRLLLMQPTFTAGFSAMCIEAMRAAAGLLGYVAMDEGAMVYVRFAGAIPRDYRDAMRVGKPGVHCSSWSSIVVSEDGEVFGGDSRNVSVRREQVGA